MARTLLLLALVGCTGVGSEPRRTVDAGVDAPADASAAYLECVHHCEQLWPDDPGTMAVCITTNCRDSH